MHNGRLKRAAIGFQTKAVGGRQSPTSQTHLLSSCISAVSVLEKQVGTAELHSCAKDDPVFTHTPLPACCRIYNPVFIY